MKILEQTKTTPKTLPSVRRSAVVQSQQSLIKTSSLGAGSLLPLVVEPNVDEVDLIEWISHNRTLIHEQLRTNGGLLFRGFHLNSEHLFQQLITSLGISLMRYAEGATPRTQLSGLLYTSTEYPADQQIALHNELTYVTRWPGHILFCCVEPAQENGQTPIADVRRVLNTLSPSIINEFRQRGWMLVRNFGEGLSLPWQQSFHASTKEEVKAYCKQARIECEWRNDERLRTRQVRPAIVRHPETKEEVWFNHVAFWHVSSLEAGVREAMQKMFAEDELPYNTYYGDGGRIEDEVVEEIRQAYRAETVEFLWERGDVLLLDNILSAHGRREYVGARRVLAAMGDEVKLEDVAGSEWK
jgi:alpha-ketoglutarate-dependent taurine dioxygenase